MKKILVSLPDGVVKTLDTESRALNLTASLASNIYFLRGQGNLLVMWDDSGGLL
jgi:hypothetical protein